MRVLITYNKINLMKASTVTLLAIALIVAFTNAANTTNTTVYCGNSNGTQCGSWLGLSSWCSVFVGTKNVTGKNLTTWTTSFCMARALVLSGTQTLNGYTGTYSCLNSGMITQVTALIASLGLFAMFA